MTDSVQRRENWEAKYNLDRVKQTLEAKRATMSAHCEAAVDGMVAAGIKVRETLNACGVNTIHHVPYLNFGRQLYKLSRQARVSDENFTMAVQVLLDKWSARGCDPRVLAKIRTDVFDISEPKP